MAAPVEAGCIAARTPRNFVHRLLVPGSRGRRRRVAWGVALGIGVAATSATQAQEGAAARECESAIQGSDWDAAVLHCVTAIQTSPDTYGIHYFLGFAYQARQEWGRAADAFEAFVAAAEAEPEGEAHLAEQLRTAVRGAALARFRAGDREDSLALLRRAAAADPADAEIAFFLGVRLVEAGDREGAEEALAVVTREAPQISQALFLLGQLRYDASDYAAARTHLEGYLQAAPAGPFRADAHWMAGSIALRSAESDAVETAAAENRARFHFAALVEAEPDTDRAAVAHYSLGTIAADREECDDARRHYEDFLRIAPDHERASDVQRYLEDGFGACSAPEEARVLEPVGRQVPDAVLVS